jgi:PAS domain S-box-containing protein
MHANAIFTIRNAGYAAEGKVSISRRTRSMVTAHSVATSTHDRSKTISFSTTVWPSIRLIPLDYATVFDAIREAILVVEPKGAIIAINRAACDLIGVRSARELDFDWWSLCPELDASSLLESRHEDPIVETTIRSREGRQIHVQLTVGECPGDDATLYVVAVRDIRPNRMAQKRVMERERLVAIGETMTALAHESRNALQRMQSCLTLVRLRGGADIQELVEDMQSAQNQLRDLYEEIRSYAAPMQLDREEIDIERLIVDVWRQLKVRWLPKDLQLEFDRASGFDTEIPADPTRLSQVLRNLLENAIEASPPHERIRVDLAEEEWEGRPASRIGILDSGPGIPAEERQRIFGLLYTTKQEGTGMGLAIAQRIVRAHGGEIAVDPDQETGCRIVIMLPRD